MTDLKEKDSIAIEEKNDPIIIAEEDGNETILGYMGIVYEEIEEDDLDDEDFEEEEEEDFDIVRCIIVYLVGTMIILAVVFIVYSIMYTLKSYEIIDLFDILGFYS